MNYKFSLLLLLPFALFAEKIHWPLNVKSHISGTFAEFRRPGVLHMGIDIKTFGMNGFKVLAPFQGYVNHLRYSQNSYGLSIDLHSPKTGLSARYAHLLDLKGKIKGMELFKNAAILLNDGNPFNLNLPANMFQIGKSMEIASSGESGSGVSHLHFELMDRNGYVNPLAYGDFVKNDYHPPVIVKLFVEDSSGRQEIFEAHKHSEAKYSIRKKIQANGKIRFKVEAYDLITSANKNNLYQIELLVGNRKVYSRKFDQIPYANYQHEKNLIFDHNRSSLSPPVYVYNLFDSSGFSVDSENIAKKQNGKIILADARGNRSELKFILQTNNQTVTEQNKTNRQLFVSGDRQLSLDFSQSIVYGNPDITIEPLQNVPAELKVNGLVPSGKMYKIETTNFTWYQPARGLIRRAIGNNEALFLYNTETSRWQTLAHKKRAGQITFEFTRPGIIAIMQDNIAPVIRPTYKMTRNIYLEPDPDMILRIYSVSDTGSGLDHRFRVMIENQNYPYYYDWDRKAILVEIPKRLSLYRKVIPVYIQASDLAGNKSEWFTDLIRL